MGQCFPKGKTWRLVMRLLTVDTLAQAGEKLGTCLDNMIGRTEVDLLSAPGNILAADVISGEDIPGFDRSTVDGYAVVAADTGGAGEGLPTFLSLVGEVAMGQAADFELHPGECAYVPTGGMLPAGADAVVMVEQCEAFGAGRIAVYHPVSVGENIIERGEDTSAGSLVLSQGTALGAQEVAALAALGIVRVPVYRRLRTVVISTGDELVAPDKVPGPGQIRDINTYGLTSLAAAWGFEIIATKVVVDDPQRLVDLLTEFKSQADLILISGGSSQGEKDATADCITQVARPGVLTHGLALKPGKPTILGYDEESRTVFGGLPGHPVSAMIAFELLFAATWHRVTHQREPLAIPATLLANLPASAGKTTVYPVTLNLTSQGYEACPVYGKSGLITTLTRAQGYLVIEQNAEGLAQGASVMIHLFKGGADG